MRSFTSGQHPLAAMSLSLQKGTISALLSCAGGEKRQQFINEVTYLKYSYYSKQEVNCDTVLFILIHQLLSAVVVTNSIIITTF